MLKQSQSQRQLQKIIPQMIQKQSLLAISTLSLEQLVKQEMEMNPLLEEADESSEEIDKQDDEISASDEAEEKPKKDDEEFDTDDYVDSDFEGFKTYEYTNNENKFNYDNLWSSKVTMKDNLLSQLHLSDRSEKDVFIGDEIIWSLDDDGFFRDDTSEIAADLEKQKTGTSFEDETFTVENVEAVLKFIQTFEPIGIASRNLKECLLVQIEESAIDTNIKNLCKKVLNDYFEEFRLKNYEKLMRELDINSDLLNKIFDQILKLNPKPGSTLDISDSFYIYPDLIITKENEQYKIELNDRSIPALKLNEKYNSVMENKSSDKTTKEFVKDNYDRARWFLESIRSRRETMTKVMIAILRRQKLFFDNKGKNLKPMLEKEIAEDISMDVSTISRTVRGKYVQTDFGIFELKHFFSYHIKSGVGDDISSKEVKLKIEETIAKEDPGNPFTDDELTEELNKVGLKMARRTVAKYREAMKIPKARLRRKL
ncbi:MAG: RNA polymerase factor sigma-54 [Ignavibacteriae bacterium]|jgi:RNA polymerase sigma-54 factor|nr:RNA polymerase factor sigma-54 [Ignavibacteriota bacterium]